MDAVFSLGIPKSLGAASAVISLRCADPAAVAAASGGCDGGARVTLAVGALSVWWALFADPATGGDLEQRLAYLAGLMSSDRVSLAFVVDIALFSVWQAFLINELDEDAPAACKFVPFWGLGAWLLL